MAHIENPLHTAPMTISEHVLTVFLLPLPALIAVIALVCAAIAALAWLAIHRLRVIDPARTPQPPFHVAVIAVFALFLSFTASDAWRRSDSAYAALLREAGEGSGLAQLLDTLAPAAPGPAASARAALGAYLDLSLQQEWAHHNTRSSLPAAAALDQARAIAIAALVQGDARAAAWRLALDRLEGMQQARTIRLVTGGLFGDILRWGGLLMLYVTSVVGMCLVHLDRRRAVIPALAVFAATATIALTLVAAVEHPYAGYDGIEPDRLMELRSRLD